MVLEVLVHGELALLSWVYDDVAGHSRSMCWKRSCAAVRERPEFPTLQNPSQNHIDNDLTLAHNH